MVNDHQVPRLNLEAALNAIGEVLAATHRSNLATQEQLGQFLDAQISAGDLLTELQSLDEHAQILADLSRACQILAEQLVTRPEPGGLDLMTDVELDVTRRALITAHSGIQTAIGDGDALLF